VFSKIQTENQIKNWSLNGTFITFLSYRTRFQFDFYTLFIGDICREFRINSQVIAVHLTYFFCQPSCLFVGSSLVGVWWWVSLFCFWILIMLISWGLSINYSLVFRKNFEKRGGLKISIDKLTDFDGVQSTIKLFLFIPQNWLKIFWKIQKSNIYELFSQTQKIN
jgi:hypothetical protein